MGLALLPVLVGCHGAGGGAGLSGFGKLRVWPAFGCPSHVWLGAGTRCVEALPHLEGFPAKREGLEQQLPSDLQVQEGKQCLVLAKQTPVQLPPVPGDLELNRKP